MAVRAGRYLRISDDREGLRAGVDRQDADTLAFVQGQGWEDAGAYTDNDTASKAGVKRPAYERLLEDVKAGRVDAIVAYAPERLTRRPVELEGVVELVEETGVQVAFVTAGFYRLDTVEGRLHARMLGSVARMEVERLSERVQRASLERAKAGRNNGGVRAYGFGVAGEDGTVDYNAVREDEAAVVREMYQRYLAGEGLRTIAYSLTQRGTPTVKGGARWDATVVRQILTSVRYIGLRAYRGTTYPAAWPALVSEEDFHAVQALLAGKTSWRAGDSRRTYLLGGLLTCGREGCGAKLQSKGRTHRGKLQRRYACEDKSRGCCGKLVISAEPLEAYIRREVKERGYGRQQSPGQLAKITAHLTALGERIDALDAAHFVEGRFSEGKYREMRAALEAKVAAGQAALEMPPPPPITADSESLEGKRQRIMAAIESITILPSQKPGMKGLDEDRVVIRWRPKTH